MQWGLTIPERLRLIIRSLAECKESTSFASVGERFRHETGRALDRDDYEAAMKKEK